MGRVKLSIKSQRQSPQREMKDLLKNKKNYYLCSICKHAVRNICLFKAELAEVGTRRKRQAPPAG